MQGKRFGGQIIWVVNATKLLRGQEIVMIIEYA